MDRIVIGRHKHGNSYKGKPCDPYIRSHTLTKRRKLYQGNPVKELINGVISKLTPRSHKGDPYYRFKQVVTADISLPNSGLLKKVKTIRQFDWDAHFTDHRRTPNAPLINRIETIIYSAIDDIILAETKVRKRNFRTQLFVSPSVIVDKINTDT